MPSKADHAHLDEALTWMIEAGCHTVTVELDTIEHIDNAYVQTLRSAQKRLQRRGGKLTVILARPEPRRVPVLGGAGEAPPIDGATSDIGLHIAGRRQTSPQ
jgi:anti-anti-sigma regulatory factor